MKLFCQCKHATSIQGDEVPTTRRNCIYMEKTLVEIGSWQDRNLKIWPTNYHLVVDDLEKIKNLARRSRSQPDHNLGQIFKLRSCQLPISTKIHCFFPSKLPKISVKTFFGSEITRPPPLEVFRKFI